MTHKSLIRTAAFAVVGLMFAAGSSLAHPNHRILGTVTMAAADHLMLDDRDGKNHTVTITADTRVTRDKKAIKAADIPVGARVVVIVVSDTDMRAKSIEVGVAPGGAGQ